MRLRRQRPFPTHPELDTTVLLLNQKERDLLVRAAAVLDQAADLWPINSQEYQDLRLAAILIEEWL